MEQMWLLIYAGSNDGFHLRVISQTFTIAAGNEAFGYFPLTIYHLLHRCGIEYIHQYFSTTFNFNEGMSSTLMWNTICDVWGLTLSTHFNQWRGRNQWIGRKHDKSNEYWTHEWLNVLGGWRNGCLGSGGSAHGAGVSLVSICLPKVSQFSLPPFSSSSPFTTALIFFSLHDHSHLLSSRLLSSSLFTTALIFSLRSSRLLSSSFLLYISILLQVFLLYDTSRSNLAF